MKSLAWPDKTLLEGQPRAPLKWITQLTKANELC